MKKDLKTLHEERNTLPKGIMNKPLAIDDDYNELLNPNDCDHEYKHLDGKYCTACGEDVTEYYSSKGMDLYSNYTRRSY